jgi:ribonucleoside-diphosphate reductase alpha chain
MRAFASTGPAADGGAAVTAARPEAPRVTGRVCPECHHPTLAKVDGCDRCGTCGWIGTCG